MNIRQLIGQMPLTLRRSIEANEMISVWLKQGYSLEEIYASSDILAAILRSMPHFERTVLETIVKRIGSEAFEWVQAEKLCSGVMPGARARLGFILLVRKGFVITLRKSWGEHLYMIPEDMLTEWQKLLLGSPAASKGNIAAMPASRQGLAEDLFALLVYLAKNEVSLTKKGIIHKRHLQKLREKLSVCDADVMHAELKYALADHYPPALAVTLDFAMRLGLISIDGNRYKLCDREVSSWLRKPATVQNGELYALWKQVACRKTALYQHFTFALEQRPEGEWLGLTETMEWIAARKIETDASVVEKAWEEWTRTWVRPGTGFGWLEARGGDSVRWIAKPGGSTKRNDLGNLRFYVQPDFEIITPPDFGHDVRWELECIAEIHKADHASVYKLTRESVFFAFGQGRTPNHIVEFLERHAMYGVPDHVRIAIEEWGAQYGKSSFSQSVGGNEQMAKPCDQQRPGLLMSDDPYSSLKLEPKLPEIRDLYPDIQEIPAMWWKDYRAYHSSTRKEMVRKAIEWKTALQIRKDGTDTVFLPNRIQETCGTWHLYGCLYEELDQGTVQEVMLAPEQWEEMKLIVPGINDK
jgi:hypothetical protein